jgi:hypothetical protein
MLAEATADQRYAFDLISAAIPLTLTWPERPHPRPASPQLSEGLARQAP